MRSFFTTFFIFITYSLIAKEVPKHLAERIANNFYSNEYARSSTKLSLTYQENLSDDKAAYYVFNVVNNPGFIIISGDDISEPILGYSDESNFHYDDNSSNPAISWLKYYKIQIENAIANGVKQSVENKEKWTNYANNVFPVKSRSTVNPLCASKWGQSPYENAQTPVDSTANNAAKRCVTGCPATAMAVIMKYHKHPAQGTGSFSYNHPKYGTLSVNFADQTYNWDNMPDLITPQTQEQIKGECAKLMSHLGISVSMQYTANSSGASPIGDEGCEGSYKKYFGYDANTVRSIRKNDSTDVAWKEVLKKELRENRPIQYAGFGNGGHTWICDGFDANDKFHMNWGWGGYLDGYFALDALAPGTGGDGAGAGTYNNNQLAVIGIKPALQQLTSAPKYGLAMSSNITSSVAKIKMNQPFSVKASLNYNSALPYTADIAAIVATESGELVDYVDYLEGKSFTNGATQEFTFETPGIPLIPGKYKIGIYSAGPKDSLWTLINQKDFTNPLLVEVESNPNDLSLASKINIPTSIVENTDFKFTADVINTSTSEYKGFVQFAMYDKDGDVYYFADENLDIALTLGAGEKKTLNFDVPTSANLIPGTYLVSLLNRKESDFDFVADGQYSNFVNLLVIESPLVKDAYENNDTPETAYLLSPNFTNNVAKISTLGSNMHTGYDPDYYTLNLPTGFEYTIKASVDDEMVSKDGKKYTVNATIASIVGNVTSTSYDNDIPSDIKINSGEVGFLISPLWVGYEGTYLLNIEITRKPTSSTNELYANSNINIYPNPASDYITIDRSLSDVNIVNIQIFDAMGQRVLTQRVGSNNNIDHINTFGLNNGIYFVQLLDEKNQGYNTQMHIIR